ncbi:outer membrane protein assembly factor BamB [Candidatus Hoaglandella endobia]|uniref:Outer membrane protein assembly factor BamB n=1 Tax=Candidatus Hoaglandella endobia TaxID=1778263 RepID=A0A143WUK8_9ENTR|nr:outer membrane protein assembly factor BamB [Candidatus Hoaglandella endobia]CUX97463.1 Outer membrane protein assembly factor BamB precursor [Candidatus Hoaglandella endobia]
MQLCKIRFLGLLSIILLSGCASLSSEEDIVTRSPLPKVNNQFQPTMVWRRSVGSGSGDFYANLHPAWQNDYVFAADRFGVVKALDADSGKERWSTDLSIRTSLFSRKKPAQLSGGVTAVDDKIYIGSELAKVYALKVQDGSLVWESTVIGEALSTPVVSNGLVLIHTSNGMLQALNEADGAVKWTVNLEEMPPLTLRGESAPTISFGAAIVGGDSGQVSAVMINQGQLIWQQSIYQPIGVTDIDRIHDVQTTPVVVNGIVYALAYNGNFAALDLRSGQLMWSKKIGSVTNLVVDDNRIYLVDQNDRVIALKLQGGVTLWRQNELLHRNLTSPVLYNSYIVTGDSEGYLHWINTDDGSLIAQQKVDSSGLLAKPIVVDNKIIVQAKNGEIYSLK